MFKVMIFVHRRPDLPEAFFRRYWREVHGPIAAAIPGVRRYVQNHAPADPRGGAAFCDGIAEMWYDDEAAYARGRATPEAKASVADLANFADVARTSYLVVDEVAIR